MPILALPGRDHTRAVGADQPRFGLAHHAPHLDHIVGGDSLGDADDQRQPGIFRLQDGIRSKRRRHEDHGGVGPGLLDGLGYGVKYRPALMRRASLARRDSAHYFGPVLCAALGMKGAFLARNALHDEPRIFVH